MQTVEIYTSPLCGFCHMAKRLLKPKSVSFAEPDLSKKPGKRADMLKRAGRKHTVPQIFIGGKHVGGCDELMALERSGKLDLMLAA